MDRLIFLGTAGDHTVYSKQARASGGFVLQTEGMQFFVDPGPGALLKAREFGINVRENTGIVVSHAHLGHCSDINEVAFTGSYGKIDPQSVLITNRTLVDDSEGKMPIMTKYFRECVERVIVLTEGNKVGINKVEVDATKAQHNDPHAVGYKFLCPNFTMGYTGDTEYFKEMNEIYKDLDILLINLQEGFGKRARGRMNADDCEKLLEGAKPNLAIITHFGQSMLKEDPLTVARELQRRTKVQVMCAKDGMAINPVSYSHGKRQKTLNVY